MTLTNNKEKYFFEINKNEDDFFYLRLKGEEDKTLLKCGSFTQKTKCQKGVKSVIRNSKNGERFGVKRSPYGRYDVYLKAVNGEIIAVSADFYTKEEAKNFIEDLKCLSPQTPVIDKTKIIIHSNKYESETFNPNSN